MHDENTPTLLPVAALLDSLTAHVAVLDAAGRIVTVNRAWRQFGEANGLPPGYNWAGTDYLGACSAPASPEGAAFAADLRAVLQDGRHECSLEYCCHAPWEKRWFLARATRVEGPGPAVVLVTHENTTTQKLFEAQLRQRAYHDALTGLPNRTWLHERFVQMDREQGPASLLLLNVKRLKRINDSLGCAAGDSLLQQLADRLRLVLPTESLLCRYDGGEFVVVLSGEEVAGAARCADLIAASLQQPFTVEQHEVTIRLEVGIAGRQAGESLEAVLSQADAARRKAAAQGAQSAVIFDRQMAQGAQERLQLENLLHRGLALGQFEAHYQPIVDLTTGRAVGAEALMRWHLPERGFVPPDQFIPLAEEMNVIHTLGRFILRQACRQLVEWGLPELEYVSVNVSARQFLRPDFVAEVESALAETGLPGERLQLELTESMVMQDVTYARGAMEALKRLGVKIALDDFGTGYSSLTYLRQFPLDVLKVDRSFTRGLGQDASTEAVMQAVITLGRALRMGVTVEGVETATEALRLCQLGCDRVQGYHFARPLPAEQFPGVAMALGARAAGVSAP